MSDWLHKAAGATETLSALFRKLDAEISEVEVLETNHDDEAPIEAEIVLTGPAAFVDLAGRCLRFTRQARELARTLREVLE